MNDDQMGEADCEHSLAERVAACHEGACPICLEDKLRVAQLQGSVDQPLRYEVATLWKVLAVLAGKK